MHSNEDPAQAKVNKFSKIIIEGALGVSEWDISSRLQELGVVSWRLRLRMSSSQEKMGGVFPEDEWYMQRLAEERVVSARIFGSQGG